VTGTSPALPAPVTDPIHLRPDVLQAARAAAADEDLDVAEWIERAIAYRLKAPRLGWRVQQPRRRPERKTRR
jgi:hypothetical protein